MVKDILFLLTGAIIGALFSWLITHLYYKKANRDSELENKNLKKYIRDIANNTEKTILENSLQWEVIDEWKESK